MVQYTKYMLNKTKQTFPMANNQGLCFEDDLEICDLDIFPLFLYFGGAIEFPKFFKQTYKTMIPKKLSVEWSKMKQGLS